MTYNEYWKTVTTHKSPSPATRRIIEQFPRGKNILDFGSGRGRNAMYLRDNGMFVCSYEPYYEKINNHLIIPDSILYKQIKDKQIDIVLCSYVLNILPRDERNIVLKQLSELYWQYLIIEVRTKGHIEDLAEASSWKEYDDGYITSRNTFQKGYRYNSLIYEVSENIMAIKDILVWRRKSGNLSIIIIRRR